MDARDVRRRWAERSGEYSPEYYAYYGPNETSELLRTILDRFVDRDDPVLEVGCSAGRHLAHLHEHGFESLAGVEVNDDAFDVMADAYPGLARDGTFYHDAIETVLPALADDQFAAVFSVETLQHVHPGATWVFPELAGVTEDLLITAENERSTGSQSDASRETEGRSVTGSGDGDAADAARPDADDPSVNYVDEGLPLYYRDWNDVFTAAGLVEVDVQPGKRTTVRTFRDPSHQGE